jgi:hypothetical protein
MAPDDNSFRILDWALSTIAGILALLWNSLNGRVKGTEEQYARMNAKLDDHMQRSADRHVELLNALHTGLNKKADK